MEIDLNVTAIIEHCTDMIMVTKLMHNEHEWPEIVYINPASSLILEYPAHELIGQTLDILFKQQSASQKDSLRQRLFNQTRLREEIEAQSRLGEPRWLDLQILPLQNAAGDTNFLSVIGRDITTQQQLQHALFELTTQDHLTNIYNRRHFMAMGNSLLSDFHRFKCEFSVILFDINEFERLHDTFGQEHCDRLLKLISETCENFLRENDIFARIDNNDFAIILKHTSITTPLQVTTRLSRAISKVEFAVEELHWKTSAHFGVAQVQPSDKIFADVLNRADQARHIAKRSQSNTPFAFRKDKAF